MNHDKLLEVLNNQPVNSAEEADQRIAAIAAVIRLVQRNQEQRKQLRRLNQTVIETKYMLNQCRKERAALVNELSADAGLSAGLTADNAIQKVKIAEQQAKINGLHAEINALRREQLPQTKVG